MGIATQRLGNSQYRYTHRNGSTWILSFKWEGKKELGWVWHNESNPSECMETPIHRKDRALTQLIDYIDHDRKRPAPISVPADTGAHKSQSLPIQRGSIRRAESRGTQGLLITVVGTPKTELRTKSEVSRPTEIATREYFVPELEPTDRIRESCILLAILSDWRYHWQI